MKNLSLQELPETYELSKSQVLDQTIQKIFSKFKFLYLSLPISKDSQIDEKYNDEFYNYLLPILFDYKLIAYHFINIDSTQKIINIVFCAEGKCLIIENISLLLTNKIIEDLKKRDIALLNCSNEINNPDKNDKQGLLNQEINNFLNHFKKKNSKQQIFRYYIFIYFWISNSETFLSHKILQRPFFF